MIMKDITQMSRKALGRGLGGLIPQGNKEVSITSADAGSNGGIKKVKIDKIKPSKWQPRSHFNPEKLQELAASIKEQGLVQPLIVRQGKKDTYELIAGERRLRAMTLLEWEEVPVCILEANDNKMRELALVENLQRDDLNAIETAMAYNLLQKEEGLTHNDIGDKLGISRAKVSNTLRLLNLPLEVKNMIAEEKISAAHGRTLLGLSEALSQIDLAKRIIEEGIAVQELEQMVKRMTSPKLTQPKTPKERDRNVMSLEDRLCSHFGTKVTVSDRAGKGTIAIKYNSHDEVAGILQKLGIDGEDD